MKKYFVLIFCFIWGFFMMILFCYQGRRIEQLNDDIANLKYEVLLKNIELKDLINEQNEKNKRVVDTCFDIIKGGFND